MVHTQLAVASTIWKPPVHRSFVMSLFFTQIMCQSPQPPVVKCNLTVDLRNYFSAPKQPAGHRFRYGATDSQGSVCRMTPAEAG